MSLVFACAIFYFVCFAFGCVIVSILCLMCCSVEALQSVCACVHACVRASVHVRDCVLVCVCLCVRAYVRA